MDIKINTSRTEPYITGRRWFSQRVVGSKKRGNIW